MPKGPSRALSTLRGGLLDVVPRTRIGGRLHRWRLLWVHRRLKEEVYPLSRPHLGRSEFRTIYTGVGAAMVVAGFAVMANWVSIVQAAVRPNGLRVAGPMFYLGAAVVVIGMYCFMASMSSTRGLWLPGKGPMIRAAEAEAIRAEFHTIAMGTLAFARVAGLTLREVPLPSVQEVEDWYANVARVGVSVWGPAGVQVVTILAIDRKRAWNKQELISEIVDPTLLNIEAMVARVSSEQIGDGLDRDTVQQLKQCFDFFSAMWDQFMPSTLRSDGAPRPGTDDTA